MHSTGGGLAQRKRSIDTIHSLRYLRNDSKGISVYKTGQMSRPSRACSLSRVDIGGGDKQPTRSRINNEMEGYVRRLERYGEKKKYNRETITFPPRMWVTLLFFMSPF